LDRLPDDGITHSGQRVPDWERWSNVANGTIDTASHEFRVGVPVAAPTPSVSELRLFDDRQAQLARLIDGELIPRLMRCHDPAHAVKGTGAILPEAAEVFTEQVRELARIVLLSDFSVAVSFVRAGSLAGVSLENLCTELLAPTARRLGDLWEQDLCHFADVTLGLWRLQQVLREFSEVLPSDTRRLERALSALLVPAPGEQHTFGLSMVMEFFLRAGWDVCGGPPSFAGELRDLVRANWFDIIGFSVSSDKAFEALASCIRELRAVSRNPVIGVLVGGTLFAHQPELAAIVGADFSVVDGHLAPKEAERFLSRLRGTEIEC
jgi:methanogenic corrinoid protein MtbC1